MKKNGVDINPSSDNIIQNFNSNTGSFDISTSDTTLDGETVNFVLECISPLNDNSADTLESFDFSVEFSV